MMSSAPKKRASGSAKASSASSSFALDPAKAKSAKPYCLDTFDGYMRARYTEGSTDYIEVGFRVNGVLPSDGWQIELSKDGMSVIWKRAIHKMCFTKEHLQALMGGKYSETHSRVIAYDNTAQMMNSDNIKPMNNFYWGTDQVVPLCERCTGTPDFGVFTYKTGMSIGKHRQYNTIIVCKVQVATQRTTVLKGAKRHIVDLMGIGSQESNDSPPPRGHPRKEGTLQEIDDNSESSED